VNGEIRTGIEVLVLISAQVGLTMDPWLGVSWLCP
jgi:hypothetical protein